MDKEIKLTGIRKIIAKRMRESLDTAAQVTQTINVDMSSVLQFKKFINEKNPESKITVTALLIKAVANALSNHPNINSSLLEEKIIFYESVNIGVAVSLRDGLVVPVIKKCNEKSIEEINAKLRELSEKAKQRKLTPLEMTGGTFTISNLGMVGIDSFSAIINTPESAILAVGATKKTPVVDVNDEIVIRPICIFTVTYDHRILDGEPVAKFMMDLKKEIEICNF